MGILCSSPCHLPPRPGLNWLDLPARPPAMTSPALSRTTPASTSPALLPCPALPRIDLTCPEPPHPAHPLDHPNFLRPTPGSVDEGALCHLGHQLGMKPVHVCIAGRREEGGAEGRKIIGAENRVGDSLATG